MLKWLAVLVGVLAIAAGLYMVLMQWLLGPFFSP